jgi:hypothetical protein
MSEVDYLFEDTTVPSGQTYASVSFLLDCKDNTKCIAVRVNGVFDSVEDTVAYSKKIVEANTITLLGELGKWLSIHPDITKLNDGALGVKELNQIMKKRIEKEKKKDYEFDLRKNTMIRTNLVDNLKLKHEVLEQKLNENNAELEPTIKSIKSQIKEMDKQKSDLDTQIKDLTHKLEVFSV